MEKNDKRNYCLDFAKGIACILVVFMHCEFPGYLGIFMQCIARFSVPLFFMISGYFCYKKNGTADYKKKIRHILDIIIYGSVLYGILAIVLQELHPLTLKMIMNWIIFNTPTIIASQMWFLFALLYDYILFAFIEKHHLHKFAYLCIPFFILVYIFMAQGLHLMGIEIENMRYRNFLIEGFPLFTLGYWFHENQEKIRIPDKVLIAVMIVTTLLCPVERALVGRDFGVNIVTFPQVISIFLFCLNHLELGKGSRMAQFGAKYSMYMYLFHPAIWRLLKKVYKFLYLRSNLVAQYMMPILCVSFTCLLSYAFLEVKKKLGKQS